MYVAVFVCWRRFGVWLRVIIGVTRGDDGEPKRFFGTVLRKGEGRQKKKKEETPTSFFLI